MCVCVLGGGRVNKRRGKSAALNSPVIYLVQSSQREKQQSSTFFVFCPAMLAGFDFPTATLAQQRHGHVKRAQPEGVLQAFMCT